jgi:hypothetical protein
MTPASTGEGESAAMLRLPAAAITSANFPNNKVISSTFSDMRIKKLLEIQRG